MTDGMQTPFSIGEPPTAVAAVQDPGSGLGEAAPRSVSEFQDGVSPSLAAFVRSHARKLRDATCTLDVPGWGRGMRVTVKRPEQRELDVLDDSGSSEDVLARIVAVHTVGVTVTTPDGETHKFGTWQEVGEYVLEVAAGSSATDVVKTVMPKAQLSQQLVTDIGEWSRGVAHLDEVRLGE